MTGLAPSASRIRRHTQPESTNGGRLLIVDDDPSAIRAMSRMLSRYPDQRFATSGADALRLARESPPDLVLLDADMPGMSGFELCGAIRADPAMSHVPVIFATSHDTPTLRDAARQHGAVDFVTKPLDGSIVAQCVSSHLRGKVLGAPEGPEGEVRGEPSLVYRQMKPRLLVVDDDVAAIQLLRGTLSDMGDLYFATSGEEAIKLAHRYAPDLILLDAQMPDTDGFEVCRALKSQPAFLQVPIVFVTRHCDPKSEMRALDLGAADFIAKPYTRAILLARVRNLLALKHRTDAELLLTREHWHRVSDTRIADIVGAASDAIVTFDAGDKLVLINEAACRMFGVDKAEAIGSPAHSLLGEFVAQLETRDAQPARITAASSDGSSFFAEMSASRSGEGEEQLTTVMLRDIGHRERLETESLARLEAEAASRSKTRMLSYIAHEMGNPLNGLLGFAELMRIDGDNRLQASQVERLGHIVTCGTQLQVLMRDVLDVGRFEAGCLNVETTSLDAVSCVAEAAASVGALAVLAGITLSCGGVSDVVRVVADAGRLQQCLLNLMTNAIKYSLPGSHVDIAVTERSREVAISIRDKGIGMNELQLRHLFEPFNRLGRHRSGKPGAGLGLVITRQLVEAMRGRLEVESSIGEGSCFTIFLPAPEPAQATRQTGEVAHER